MDEEIAKWIIEFLLRQDIEDRILNDLIGALPLPKDDAGLGKALLLRRIAWEASDGSVSEIMLEILEMVEEFDHTEGKPTLESMKSAYCAVAVDCTTRFLDEEKDNNVKYIATARRIWEEKVDKLEKGKPDLVSERLLRWKQDILSATLDSHVRHRILSINTRKEALKAVKVYVREAWTDMGPSFLELVAKNRHNAEGEVDKETNGGETSRQIVVYNGQAAGHRALATPYVDCDTIEVEINLPRDDHAIGNEGTLWPQSPPDRHEKAARQSRRMPRAITKAKIIDSGHPYAPEFFGMQVKGSNSHSEEVQTVERVAADKGAETSYGQSASVDMDADINEDGDTTQIGQGGNVTQFINNPPSKASLMDRNSTAQTYRWEDSAEDSLGASPIQYRLPENSADPSVIHARMVGSKRRRPRKKWSRLEEDALRDGVARFGRGNWKVILNAFRDVFEERTDVDLKDKWRNLTK